jgi:hypothetical protein
MENQQLIKKDRSANSYSKIFPWTFTDLVLDRVTKESLDNILVRNNFIALPYVGSKAATRLQVPMKNRRRGIWLSYIDYAGTLTVEYYNDNNLDDNHWQDSSYWLPYNTAEFQPASVGLSALAQEVFNWINSQITAAVKLNPEDLQKNSSGQIEEANRAYDTSTFSGLGYRILRKNIQSNKNILTQSMINMPNTIYEIRYDFDLNGSTINIPENCELKFVGGSLKNGTINGNIINDYIKPEWFGAKGDGSTDDTKAIQTIINLNSKKIVFPNNRTFLVSNLYISNSLKIEGNGSTLLFNTDCYATINYHINISSDVSNIEWVSSSPRTSKIYISNTSDYKKGDIIKIYSDDIIEGTEFKQSQYFIVGNIYSNYIEVTGKVIFNFTTNIKIQLIDNSKKIEVNNLILSSKEHTYYNDRGLFTIIGGSYHNIKDCSIKNTNSHGFLFAGSYGYNVENLELDYQEFINTVPQSIGMGVCDSASSNFTISFKGGYTQAFTCVYFSEIDYPETYGVSQFGNIKNSVATGSALDNHANCYNLVYSDSIISSSENGIVIRGGKCIYDNISVNAAIYGLYVYADSHNAGNSIDFLVRNTNIYSHTRCVQIENNKEFKIKGVIENCVLEGRTAAVYLKNADILFRNCTITGLITISNNVNVIFDNCTLNGYINIAESIIDSNVIIRNSIVNANNHLSFRACPTIIENTTINVNGNYYILVTLATNIVFSKVTFYTSYQYLLRTQNSTRVELNDCVINHTGINEEFHVFRTVGITIDVVLKAIFNNISIYNKASQSTIVYLSYVDSWKGGSSINNRVKSVYVDNSLLDGVYICNRTDRIMVINDIIDNPYYIERGNINTDGTLKDKEVIVYRVEDIIPGLTDTIYKIVKDIDLNGTSKGIPANCTLDFQGGSFSNGTIVGSNTKIKAGIIKIFDNITINGTWNNDNSYLEWFNLVNSKYPINEALKLSNNLRLLKNTYSVTTISIPESVCIQGESTTESIINIDSTIDIDNNNIILKTFSINPSDTFIGDSLIKVHSSYYCVFEKLNMGSTKVDTAMIFDGTDSSYYHIVTNCNISSFNVGIKFIGHANANSVLYNNFYLVKTNIVIDSCNGLRIIGNTFQDFKVKGVDILYSTGSRPVGNSISSNYFEGDKTVATCDIDFNNTAEAVDNMIIGNHHTYMASNKPHILNMVGPNTIIDSTRSTIRNKSYIAGIPTLEIIEKQYINALGADYLISSISPVKIDDNTIEWWACVQKEGKRSLEKVFTFDDSKEYIQMDKGLIVPFITQYYGQGITLGYDANLSDRKLTFDNQRHLLKYGYDNKWNYVSILLSGTTSERPSADLNMPVGLQYYDTTLGKLILWNGTTWINVDGTALT